METALTTRQPQPGIRLMLLGLARTICLGTLWICGCEKRTWQRCDSMKRARALELLLEDPGFTSLQIAEKLNVSRVSVTKYLKALKEKGIISRIGSDRKGYWRINQ
ncbi:MAG: HTH domain-containing protein [Oscillospiraceae bacterium]|nr:HTH domain-containing protein [Oscillospiraceae bacterium]